MITVYFKLNYSFYLFLFKRIEIKCWLFLFLKQPSTNHQSPLVCENNNNLLKTKINE
jgi:hypothetical protein